MTTLEPVANRAVREAVRAFLEGRFVPERPRGEGGLPGEVVLDTTNSRYRLLDGVVRSAPDGSIIGAELVGWLRDEPQPSVERAWQPGARAVLVDRRRDRAIIVTSTSQRFVLEARPLPPPVPPPLGKRIIHDGAASGPKPRTGQARAVHPPPRPIGPPSQSARPQRPPAPAPSKPVLVGLGPQAAPNPAPSKPALHRDSPPSLPRITPPPLPWALRSADFDFDGEVTHADLDDDAPTRYNATPYQGPIGWEQAFESSEDSPIPLIRHAP